MNHIDDLIEDLIVMSDTIQLRAIRIEHEPLLSYQPEPLRDEPSFIGNAYDNHAPVLKSAHRGIQ